MTQLQAVKQFLALYLSHNAKISTWELERQYIPFKHMMGSTTLRHARTLESQGFISHPVIEGKTDVHSYILKKEELF